MRRLHALSLAATAACSSGVAGEPSSVRGPVAAAAPVAAGAPPAAGGGAGTARDGGARRDRATVYLATAGAEAAVTVEVVASEPLIERGLMFREHLPPDGGMLFLMGQDVDWAFWMKNTLISLDMIFIDADLIVAGVVERAEPRTLTQRRVGKLSRYVLEVNGGWARAHGVEAGARARFDGVEAAAR